MNWFERNVGYAYLLFSGVVGLVVGASLVGMVLTSEIKEEREAVEIEINTLTDEISTLTAGYEDALREAARERSRNGALRAQVQGFEAREAERQAEMDRIAEEQRIADRVAAILAERDNE